MNRLRVDTVEILAARGSVSYGNSEETSASRRAFERGDLLHFTVSLPRQLGVTKAWCCIKNDKTGEIKRFPLLWSGMSSACENWTLDLSPNTFTCGLYFLRVEMESLAGYIMTVRDGGEECRFVPVTQEPYTYQLTISKFVYENPAWIQGGTIYQVFVDRFCRGSDSPVREDAILNTDWERGIPQYPAYPGAPLANNMFFGGNLDGVTKKLDYIASLGVNCIYLSPIFRAYSNHKYDTGDYMEIDEMFGGEASFRTLLSEAKKHGIRIVLDGVFNHTGDDSRYFNRKGTYDSIGAYQSPESPYYSWYDFHNYPEEYTCWWDIKILPRIHTTVPACRDYFLAKDGVIDHYAKMGIGGMRLDVVDELSDEFVAGLKARLVESTPDAILYGEVWEDASNKIAYGRRREYYQGRELDGVMNYCLRTGLIDFVRHSRTEALSYALCEVMPNAPKRVQDVQMNLFGTHDTERILTALAADERGTRTNDELAVYRMPDDIRKSGIRRLKCAYMIMATLPGVPLIYYGDEVGMEGYSDPFNRMPFPWHDMDESLLSFYRAIGEIRRKNKVYCTGDFRLHHLSSGLLAFSRAEGDSRYVTVINNSDETITTRFGIGARMVLHSDENSAAWELSPRSGMVVKCKSGSKMTIE